MAARKVMATLGDLWRPCWKSPTIFDRAFGRRKAVPGGLHPDVVDQARRAELRSDEDPYRSVVHRGDRRQRLGVPRLEIVQREAGGADQFAAGFHRGVEIAARLQALGAFLHGAVERR